MGARAAPLIEAPTNAGHVCAWISWKIIRPPPGWIWVDREGLTVPKPLSSIHAGLPKEHGSLSPGFCHRRATGNDAGGGAVGRRRRRDDDELPKMSLDGLIARGEPLLIGVEEFQILVEHEDELLRIPVTGHDIAENSKADPAARAPSHLSRSRRPPSGLRLLRVAVRTEERGRWRGWPPHPPRPPGRITVLPSTHPG
jgi:hypothetical protein